jgi:hypothetical protein
MVTVSRYVIVLRLLQSSLSDLTIQFLALLLSHILAATPEPGLHRRCDLGGALTAHL